MARMPGARWLGEHGSRRMSRYDVMCYHTIVGRAPAHAAHFSVRGDGEILQSRDTRYRSAANLDGNHRIIAIENEDMGPDFGAWPSSTAAPPLTGAQIESNARILAWAHREHGVPLQLCPDSRPTSRGLAYHRQGVDGNWAGYNYGGRVSGGEVWSSARGKVCPTDPRIAQRTQILERARQIVAGQEEDDMVNVTDAQLARLLTAADRVDAIASTVSSMRQVVQEELREESERTWPDYVGTADGDRPSITRVHAEFSARRDAYLARQAISRQGAVLEAQTQLLERALAGQSITVDDVRQAMDDVLDQRITDARVELVVEGGEEPT